MKIAIIGSGNVGAALGSGWLKMGHTVLFGVRDLQSAKTQKAREQISGAIFTSLTDAVIQSQVIVFTIPPDTIIDILSSLPSLENKILIDATNSVRVRPEPYSTSYHAIKAITKTEKAVKCFNSTGYENMQNPSYPIGGLDMFMAGNDAESKSVVKQLALDLGFENCYDFGGDDKVELLEKFALCWINLAIMQGMGRNIGFKIVKR